MALHHDPLIERYSTRVRFIAIGVILGVVLLFFVFPRFFQKTKQMDQDMEVVVETFDIPPTQQFEAPPPPARPSIPIESEDEDIAEDITIEETDLEDFIDWDVPPPPPPDEGPRIRFIPYDEAPEPIGGYVAIQRNVVYPQIAQEAGIEGTVVVQAFVGEDGRVTETVILKGIPNTGLDEAAMAAIKRTKFKPAKQRDRAVGVWISIPVHFRLK